MDLRTTVSLLPTPRASDGEKGGPNQRGSKGDLALPSAVVHLLPTPAATDSTGTANFRPDGTPYGQGYGPTLTDATRLLPTPTATDGDRTSTTYSRGNPTLRGAVSSPPSAGGKRSSAAPPPGQLTLWDG
ncbi:hypothetical protein [Streptomyces sp. NPDC056669]|uniref:hypothetical protein n=1 Tax=Streptomyces sp. NPDC056669 TaxID=3345903 RepID=UPI0036CA72D5